MKNISILLLSILLFYCQPVRSQTIKILFDATKAETASNADWVIDEDLNNLDYNSSGAVLGGSNEGNAQKIPTPAQSGITGSTPETYWKGALSYWGIDCVNRNYTVETLPYNGQITYGNGSNPQDLSNYKVFIVCEPNLVFTAAEKTAILNFVQNGGGLFMISDHDVSDRNGDGWDSPHIWNDLMSNNTVQSNPFGMTFDYVNFSQTTSNIPSLPGDSILHGSAGNVTQAKWSNGTTLTLNTSMNSSVKGVIYKTGSSFGNTNVMCAYARYGNGKVASIGDSSPCDDGTGDTNDQLYNGYITDASGNHRKLLMNITIWLATSNTLVAPTANFTANPLTVCLSQSTTFTNSSSGTVTSYSWNFGSGATPATASTAGPHTVSYSTSGLKTVSLTVSNSAGSNMSTKSNYVNVSGTCSTLDVGVLSLLNPVSSLCPTFNNNLQVRVKNYGTTTINFSTNPVDVLIQVTDPASAVQSFTKTISTGSLAAGATTDVTFSNTYDLSAQGNYIFNANTALSSDANSSNNAMAAATVTVTQSFQSDYTVVSEDMGTVTSTTSISAHETNNGFQNDNLTMSGTADVRTTTNSTGYATASGGANVFFTFTIGKNFIISGINSTPYSNLQLSFGFFKPGTVFNASEFFVQVSSDGISYNSLTFPSLPTAQGWYYVTLTGDIPSTPNLRIQFIQNQATDQFRVDDVLLVDQGSLPIITTPGPVNLCQGETVVLTASTAASYLWSNGVTTQSNTVSASGSYYFTATSSNGCTAASAPIDIAVNPLYNSTVNASICPGSTYTLPDGVVVSTTGNYVSTLQSISGCDSIINTNLTVLTITDNNACTTDACDTSTLVITHTAVNTSDGNACTTDNCNTSTGSITHTAVNTSDGNACTTDNCNTSTGSISHTAINTSDGNACTTDDCNTSTGSITHTAINTSDGNACTTDDCNTSTGSITHTAINTSDGNACTTDDCNTSTGSITHTAINTSDGNACTTDDCNTSTGSITHVTVNTSDGNSCTTDDCNTSTGSITHTALNTSDANACTTDDCNTSTGSITHAAINTSDGNACTTDDCNTLNGSVIHTFVNIDDGNSCTTDVCNTSSGSITHTAVIIDDGDACTADACNTITGTITHTAVNTDDGNICTVDGCDSITGIYHNTAVEICGNNIDDNCDGFIDEGCSSVTLSLNLFIEGFYLGGNTMIAAVDPVLYPSLCDTITVELHNSIFPYSKAFEIKSLLQTNGTSSSAFSPATFNNSYYIVIRHRNAIETWSANPVLFNTLSMSYDFSTTPGKAYGNNLSDLGDGNFALISGDVNNSGIIDLADFSLVVNSAQLFDFGYKNEDVTGDGLTESSDYCLVENNLGKLVAKP